jgi:hypothetical protein
MISDETRDRWKERCDFLVENMEMLNEWEQEFIDSISIKIEHDKDLSLKQSTKLAEIYKMKVDQLG